MGCRVSGAVALLAALAYACILAILAGQRPLHCDEPLWFMRSASFTPADASAPAARYWNIDIPGLNRWYWHGVLALTNSRVPIDTPSAWTARENRLYLNGNIYHVQTYQMSDEWLRRWSDKQGYYAPRGPLLTMRYGNCAVFLVALACLWAAARGILRNDVLAALAVLPVAASPVFWSDVAIESGSGDGLLVAALAALLAAWLHLRGRAATWPGIVLLGALAGLAVSAKHPGIVGLAALAGWLAWRSRGWRRLTLPLAACAVAFAVFAAVNPCVARHPAGACLAMIARRQQNAADHARWLGVAPLSGRLAFLRWRAPLAMALPILAWRNRREPCFPVVGAWAVALIVPTIIGAACADAAFRKLRYWGPLEMAALFCLGLWSIILLSGRAPTQKKRNYFPPSP